MSKQSWWNPRRWHLTFDAQAIMVYSNLRIIICSLQLWIGKGILSILTVKAYSFEVVYMQSHKLLNPFSNRFNFNGERSATKSWRSLPSSSFPPRPLCPSPSKLIAKTSSFCNHQYKHDLCQLHHHLNPPHSGTNSNLQRFPPSRRSNHGILHV